MRAIDADCLECKIASFVHENSDKGVSSFLVFLMANKMREMIKNTPVITLDELLPTDTVQVVRCKDCSVPHNKWTGCPKMNGTIMPPDGFCSYGERREADG